MLVMPGLVPGIHVFPHLKCSQVLRGVDGRVKPGHDDNPLLGTAG